MQGVGQLAASLAGVVLVFAVSHHDGRSVMFLLDGETHMPLANLSLPFAPLSDAGLHNHFSAFPTST